LLFCWSLDEDNEEEEIKPTITELLKMFGENLKEEQYNKLFDRVEELDKEISELKQKLAQKSEEYDLFVKSTTKELCDSCPNMKNLILHYSSMKE
jgi:molecular chaperone GrpE (heat shock protein)